MSEYTSLVSWETKLIDVQVVLGEPFYYTCKVASVNPNDFAPNTLGIDRFYVVDYTGKIYQITEIVDVPTKTIKIYDLIEDADEGPYISESAFVYQTRTGINVLTQAQRKRLHPSAMDQIWNIENNIIGGDYFWNKAWGAARIYGGIISSNGDGTIDITAGKGFIKASDDVIEMIPDDDLDAPISKNSYVEWDVVSSLALVDNAYNYIYYDGVDAQIKVTTDLYTMSFYQDFSLGRCYRTGNDVVVRLCGTNVWNFNRRVQLFGEERFPVEHAKGLMIGNPSGLYISMTEGILWAELVNRFTVDAFDSSGTDRFTYWYRDGAGDWTSVATQSVIDNTNWDDNTGTLNELTANRYGVHWVYVVHNSTIHVVYGQSDYTLANATEATPPSSIPGLLAAYSTLIGKIIVQKGDVVFYSVESPFVERFSVSGITDHSELSGLTTGDPHTQYPLLLGRSGDILKIDELQEFTLDNGITLDSGLIKDGRFFNSTDAAPTLDTELVNLKYLTDTINSASNYQYKGYINVNTDFPLIADVVDGDWYTIGTDVTDDAGATYTNTGLSFTIDQTIYWDGSTWQDYATINDSNYLLLGGRAGGQIAAGGTAVTDRLILKGTTGNGTLTSPAIQFNVGNNGATNALTILNNGVVTLGYTSTNRLLLPLRNAPATPTIAFGDGDSGFYEGSDDLLYCSIAGTSSFVFSSIGLAAGSGTTGNAYMLKQVSSNVLPCWSFAGDTNTGIGRGGVDILSLIAGGIESVRITTTALLTNTISEYTASNGVWIDGLGIKDTGINFEVGATTRIFKDGSNNLNFTDAVLGTKTLTELFNNIASHTHGNISNDGKIGSTTGLMIKTGASGVLEALAAGSAGQFLKYDGTWDMPAGGITFPYIVDDASTNTAIEIAEFRRTSSGAPSSGIGGYLSLGVEDDSGTTRYLRLMHILTDAVGAGSPNSMIKLQGYTGSAISDFLAINSSGTGVAGYGNDSIAIGSGASATAAKSIMLGSGSNSLANSFKIILNGSTVFHAGTTLGTQITVNADPDTNLINVVNGVIAYDSTDHEIRAYKNGSWGSIVSGEKNVIHIAKAEVLYTNQTQTTIITLPANAVVWSMGLEVITVFNDSGTDFLNIGTTSEPNRYLDSGVLSSLLFTFATLDIYSYSQSAERLSATTNITFTYDGQNNDATQGQTFVYIHYSLH